MAGLQARPGPIVGAYRADGRYNPRGSTPGPPPTPPRTSRGRRGAGRLRGVSGCAGAARHGCLLGRPVTPHGARRRLARDVIGRHPGPGHRLPAGQRRRRGSGAGRGRAARRLDRGAAASRQAPRARTPGSAAAPAVTCVRDPRRRPRHGRRGPAWARWVDALPRLVAELLEEWQLTRRRRADARLLSRSSSRCAPPADRPAVLKVELPRRGVRARAPRAAALARPRRGPAAARRPAPRGDAARAAAPARTSPDSWDLEACEVVAGLYARLHVPALPQLRTAHVVRRAVGRRAGRAAAQRAAAATAGRAGDLAVPRLRRRPGQHRDDDPRRPALRERAGRGPRALAGDRPQADERRPALRAGADAVEPVRGARRRRRATGCGGASTPWSTHAGLDEDRARDWVVVRDAAQRDAGALQDALASAASAGAPSGTERRT